MTNPIQINSIEEALTKIDKSTVSLYIKSKTYFKKEIIFKGNFNSLQEISTTLQERIIETITDYLNETSSEISELRKSGQDVELLNLEFLTIPLKIKILEAEFSEKNLDTVITKFQKVKQEIQNLTPKEKPAESLNTHGPKEPDGRKQRNTVTNINPKPKPNLRSFPR